MVRGEFGKGGGESVHTFWMWCVFANAKLQPCAASYLAGDSSTVLCASFSLVSLASSAFFHVPSNLRGILRSFETVCSFTSSVFRLFVLEV